MTHTTLSHGNAEDLYIQMSKHLNCPHCGGSGHVDDVAQPEQEPIAFIDMREWPPIRWRDGMVRADVAPFDGQGLFFAPTQRKPQFKEFIKWAGAQGYDCAQTCNSDTGEWICLNPMTADLWKAWQAAHGVKS